MFTRVLALALLMTLVSCVAWQLRDPPPELIVSGVPEQPKVGVAFEIRVAARFPGGDEDVSDVASVRVNPPEAAFLENLRIEPLAEGAFLLHVEALGVVHERRMSATP